jgi:hypothetical protein
VQFQGVDDPVQGLNGREIVEPAAEKHVTPTNNYFGVNFIWGAEIQGAEVLAAR